MPKIQFGHAEPTWFHILTRYLPPWMNDLVLTTLFIVLVLALAAYFGTRHLRRSGITHSQAMFELIGEGFANFVSGIIGPRGRRYVPLIGTLFLFILAMNLFGIIPGFISPTTSLNTTIALALAVFVIVQVEGIRAHGLKHYIMHFAGEPLWLAPLMFPLHVIGELAKPLSLSLRLAGNIFAEDAVILILGALSPFLYLFLRAEWARDIPLFPTQILILPLMIFFGTIQALVFAMLSAIYITVMIGDASEEAPAH